MRLKFFGSKSILLSLGLSTSIGVVSVRLLPPFYPLLSTFLPRHCGLRNFNRQVQEIFSARLKENISNDTIAQVDDLLEILVSLKCSQYLLFGFAAEVVELKFDHFA